MSATAAPAATRFDSANALAALGVSVIPIAPGTKEPPLGFKWGEYQQRHADASERYEWFVKNDYQLAVVSGAISNNLVIVDYDGPGGFDSHAAAYPRLLTLPRVRTARGVHVWIRTKQPTRKYVTTAPDGSRLEVRGEGHYTLCPPSIHPSGDAYRWEVAP